jgi:hypothetical protein
MNSNIKAIKLILGIFIITGLLSVFGVSAYDQVTFTNITIPSFSVSYTSPQVTKEDEDCQALYTSMIKDSITGGNRAVQARVIQQVEPTYGTLWADMNVGVTFNWASSMACTIGYPRIELRAKKSTLASIKYSGIWFY